MKQSLLPLKAFSLATGLLLLASPSWAANGTWAVDADGLWSGTGNWAGGVIADGAGSVANFSNLNITGTRFVTLDSSRTVGTLTIGDPTASPSSPYVITASGTSTLTFDNNGSGAVITKTGVGTQFITAPIVLADNLAIGKSVNSALTIQGNITGTGNITFNTTNGGAFTVNTGVIDNVGSITNNSTGIGPVNLGGSGGSIGANVTALVQNSLTSDMSLSGNNTLFSGSVVVQAGTVTASQNTALNANNLVALSSSGTFQVGSTGALTISGLSGAGGIVQGNNSTGARSLILGGSGSYNYAGTIVNSGTAVFTVTKSGSGTQILSGQNTYSGTTSVTAGTLLVNNSAGSATGSGVVAVSGTGTVLGGTGRMAPSGAAGITIGAGSIVSPGAGGIESLEIALGSTTGIVSLQGDSKFVFELGAAGASIAAPGSSDLLLVSGASSSDFSFSLTGNAIDFAGTGAVGWYKLFDTDIASGTTWANLTLSGQQIVSGLTVVNLGGGLTGTLYVGDGTTGDYDDIYLQVTPEPSASLLTGLGLAVLIGWCRRARGRCE